MRIAFHHTDSVNRIVVVVAAYDSDGWNRLSKLQKLLMTSLLIGIAAAAAWLAIYSHGNC